MAYTYPNAIVYDTVTDFGVPLLSLIVVATNSDPNENEKTMQSTLTNSIRMRALEGVAYGIWIL